MKATITLELKTREAHQLFQRKINDDRLFVDAILHKLNKITGLYRKKVPGANEQYQSIQKNLNRLSQPFADENKTFQNLLQKEEILKNKKITFSPLFSQGVIIENPLTIDLIKVIEDYNELISTIKLLHLTGCFQSTHDYYVHMKQVQKMINQILSQKILTNNIT